MAHIPVRQFVEDLSSSRTETTKAKTGKVGIFILEVLRI